MITDLRSKIPVKEGSITCGTKTTSKGGKEIPKSLDYFNISDFPELTASYGDKPSKLVIFFPTNDIKDFLDINYVLYGSGNQLIRKCDGESCFHRIAGEVERQEYAAGTTTPCICKDLDLQKGHKKKCKPFFWMKVFVGDLKLGKVDSPMCYLFKTGSKNSAENIITEITKILHFNKSIIGIPFGLKVEMVDSSAEAGVKFPIWKLEAIGSLTMIRKLSESVEMRIPKKSELKQLAEPIPEDIELIEENGKPEEEKKEMNQEAQDLFTPENDNSEFDAWKK